MCEYICTPLYVNVYVYVFICMHVHLAIYIDIDIDIIHVGTHQRTHVYTCVCICMMHMYMHVRMSAYIGKNTWQKRHASAFAARACVCAYTYTHIKSTAFRTQAFQHTDTHTDTHTCKHMHVCINACAHVDTRFADHNNMRQLVQHVRYIDWHILRPAVLRHIMHTRIRISYMELHPSMCVS